MHRKHDESFDFLYKVVLAGDSYVGKTHLLARFVKGSDPKNHNPTIGVEFVTHTVQLDSGDIVKTQIWDTAGQERYRSITSAHYRRAAGSLLVYDVTNRNSFRSVTRWIEEIRDHAGPDIVIMLVGNKVDLGQEIGRQVQTQEAQDFAEAHQLMYKETSATQDINVKEAFKFLLGEIYKRRLKNRTLIKDSTLKQGTHLAPIRKNYENNCC